MALPTFEGGFAPEREVGSDLDLGPNLILAGGGGGEEERPTVQLNYPRTEGGERKKRSIIIHVVLALAKGGGGEKDEQTEAQDTSK